MPLVFDKPDSGRWIEGHGRVHRLLADEHTGGRHQRFIVTIGGEQTLLITHNTDVAPRVPVGIGDRIAFRGIYEWNDLGGLVHWTHHDPHGDSAGGYIRFRRRVYA